MSGLKWAPFNFRFVIERRSLNGTIREPVVTSAVFNIEGLAVDWMGRNIYWTDEVRIIS